MQQTVAKTTQAETVDDINEQTVDVAQQNKPVSTPDDTDNDMLATRLQDTRDWLLRVPDNHYSIQLFMARKVDAEAVEQFLRDSSDTLDFEKVYIYETQINGRPMYSVLYDEYNSRQTARVTLNSLPDDLQASKPYLRRVSALRKDLVLNNDSVVSSLQ